MSHLHTNYKVLSSINYVLAKALHFSKFGVSKVTKDLLEFSHYYKS